MTPEIGPHVRDDLVAHLDGALQPTRANAVLRHLEVCAACRAERDRIARGLAALAALPPPPEPSPFFAARLEARLAGEREGRSTTLLARLALFRWRIPAAATALVAAAMVAVVGVRQERRSRAEAIAANLELFENYEVVASLDDVPTQEDVNVVAHLDELAREARP